MKTISIPALTAESLRQGLLSIEGNPYEDPDRARGAASREVRNHLPVAELLPVRNEAGDCDILRFRGLPVDPELCPTPEDWRSPPKRKETFVSEHLLIGLAAQADLRPFGYANEKDGAIIHQVCPMPGKESAVSSNSAGDFGLHSETPHSHTPPEFFFLLCLRGNRQALSPLASLDDILDLLPKHVITVLQEARFVVQSGQSYERQCTRQLPVLYRDEKLGGGLRARFHAHNMSAIEGDTQASWALAKFRMAVTKAQVFTTLYPGDLIFFNNTRVLHGRTAFKPIYNGHQRWLQRCYLTRDFKNGPVADAGRYLWHDH